ncbi:MAG: PD40 domain-containing protein [Bacteroidetes bacterium]|nr:PD40 domain-containing protein [Bacteroidota bacterium]
MISLRKILAILLVIGSTCIAFSQNSNLTEGDLISEAQDLYNNKDFQKALPLYAQLVSVYPDDPVYNYRFGVCALYGDRKNKSRPVKYLNKAAVSMKDNQKLFYHLGFAYHQNQDFANAMKYYKLYLAKLSPAAPERAQVLEKINACLNGLNLSDKNLVSEIIVKSEFQKDNFHRAYKADDFDGMLLLKPDIFQSAKDENAESLSYVFISQPNNILYFSSYGNDGSENKDIYKTLMDENGEWGEFEKVESIINTPYDEDYPILMDNGTTLFFCSKGHNSLGGYDIFRSKLDVATNTWNQPENLGSGINSPFDDIMFVLNKEKGIAYFASDRDNLNNSINVFKVKLIENPFNDEVLFAEEEADGNEEKENDAYQTTNPETHSNPSKRAAVLMDDRAKSHQLADSAYLLVAHSKSQIRELTNKRDRANNISQNKDEEAKSLEIPYKKNITKLATISESEVFEKELDNTIQLKKEIFQLSSRSNHANFIARVLGNQIKIKNNELTDLKNDAGKVQTLSVTGTFEEANEFYVRLLKKYYEADTLTDYTDQLMLIADNSMEYEIPESELAFAGVIKQNFQNQAILNQTQKTKKAVLNENVTIVIVDNRKSPTQSVTVDKVEPVEIISPINTDELALKDFEPEDDELEINFNIDKVEPVEIISPINTDELALKDFEPEDDELEINFNIDKVEPVEIISPINTDELALKDFEPEDDELEINFNIDKVELAANVIEKQEADIPPAVTFKSKETLSIPEIKTTRNLPVTNPAFDNNRFLYLKESIIFDKSVETAGLDTMSLSLAITQPDLLSYEELLYAAYLINNPEDKLIIYTAAFTYVDRDWRAYNNAAVTSIRLNKLEQANCYLIQALLISENNGIIHNNLGILACYIQNFYEAEHHFIAAWKFGEDSDHNLQEVIILIENRFELSGDIIKYTPMDE